MLTLNWQKIDKFYLIYASVAVVLAVLLIYTVRTIFTSYFASYETGKETANSTLKVNKDQLDEVYNWVFNKESVSLNIRE